MHISGCRSLKPPSILAVHLKRFEFSESGNRIKKSEHVTFELELGIAPFVVDAESWKEMLEAFFICWTLEAFF